MRKAKILIVSHSLFGVIDTFKTKTFKQPKAIKIISEDEADKILFPNLYVSQEAKAPKFTQRVVDHSPTENPNEKMIGVQILGRKNQIKREFNYIRNFAK